MRPSVSATRSARRRGPPQRSAQAGSTRPRAASPRPRRRVPARRAGAGRSGGCARRSRAARIGAATWRSGPRRTARRPRAPRGRRRPPARGPRDPPCARTRRRRRAARRPGSRSGAERASRSTAPASSPWRRISCASGSRSQPMSISADGASSAGCGVPCVGAQDRDEVVDVEASEQHVDELARPAGVERAHLLQRAAQVHADRVVEPAEAVVRAASPRRPARTASSRARASSPSTSRPIRRS